MFLDRIFRFNELTKMGKFSLPTFLTNDPYVYHLQCWIDCYLIPYQSINDIKHRRIDWKRFYKILVIIFILFLNIFRLIMISFYGKSLWVIRYFVPFYVNQANDEYIYFSFLLLFLYQSISCKYYSFPFF